MSDAAAQDLARLLGDEVAGDVGPSVTAVADKVRQRFTGVCAILYYGSGLREGNLSDKIIDLYVLVERYKTAHGRSLPAFFNWLLPPNVGYLETKHGGTTLRAKYAVISLRDFERGAGRWFHSYVWARFAQPCRMPYCRDPETKSRVVRALATAIHKLAHEAGPMVPAPLVSSAFWPIAFCATYRAELRAEGPDRAQQLYAADRQRYDAVFGLVFGADPRPSPARFVQTKWLVRRLQGKLLSVARLAKAAFTFEDGAGYILWKIERHSGVTITPSPWQRRHPILASTTLFWRLYCKGAFK